MNIEITNDEADDLLSAIDQKLFQMYYELPKTQRDKIKYDRKRKNLIFLKHYLQEKLQITNTTNKYETLE